MAGARAAVQRRANGGTGFAQAGAEQVARERAIIAIFIWLSDESELENVWSGTPLCWPATGDPDRKNCANLCAGSGRWLEGASTACRLALDAGAAGGGWLPPFRDAREATEGGEEAEVCPHLPHA